MAKHAVPSPRHAGPAPRRPRLGGPTLLGLSGIALFFCGFGAWAAVAPLSSAAAAAGQVRVESHRKTIQHLEGGIIREILVREGDVVTAGQVLMRLDDVQARASVDLLSNQLASLKAEEARLLAERDGRDAITWPDALQSRRDEPAIAAVIEGQERIFTSRRVSLSGQVDVLRQKMSQLASEIEANRAQYNAADNQMRFAGEEIATVRGLAERGFETRTRLLALEREMARLEGERGEQLGMIARAEQSIGEAQLQIADLSNAMVREAAAGLRETQVRIGEIEDRLRAADDIESRTAIVAPEAGRVVKLRYVTPGGVLRPGEPILDLVPSEERFVIDARISPMDIDSVHPGLSAEIRLSSLKQRTLPIILGTVETVSADALTDERTGQPFYLAQVDFDLEELSRIDGVQLYPGMPAEVLVVTGQRTPLDYFIDPVRDSFHRAFREQ